MAMLTHELTYHHDSARLFERIAYAPWAMMLDSGQIIDPTNGEAGSQFGRYDIIVANPIATLVTRGDTTTISQNGEIETSQEDPFVLLKKVMNRVSAENPTPEIPDNIPFAGGALGYFAYDLARRLEKLDDAKAPEIIPEMMIGLYDWALVVDHRAQRSTLISYGFSLTTHENWAALCAMFEDPFYAMESAFFVTAPIDSNLTKATYSDAFHRVQAYISAGDCYQVNLAQRFSTHVEGDAWQAYKLLRKVSPAPFMAYMHLPLGENESFQVLSDSPERFIHAVGGYVETRPIKGTRPRASDPVEDLAYASELLASIKDRAENLMIVDLLRNDLGKSCEIGSVKAEKLFQLQSFVNVHHLVSFVTGKLKQGATAIDLLKGCFPGGSITGAPKVRAMQIIDELEPHRRGIYCGSIGYIGFNGDMDTNIAIRTAIICRGQLSFYAGGGIVTDSDAEKEYGETLNKASSIMAILKHFMRH